MSQGIEAKGYWFSETMYPPAGSNTPGILACIVAIWFLGMSALDKGRVENGCAYACWGLGIAFTLISLILTFFAILGQTAGEIDARGKTELGGEVEQQL